jgi:peptide/nickel transport system substrate-binding protein
MKRQHINRREFLGKSIGIAAGLGTLSFQGALLSSCSSPYNATSSPLGRGRPVYGGNLIFGVEAEESGFDPRNDRFDSTGVMYARTVFDPLAIIDAAGNVQPYLAESITPNADYSSWQIRMRPNLYFHDGTPCDAAAVKENFVAFMQPSTLVHLSIPLLESVQILDQLTVQLNMSAPWVPFNYWLAGLIGGQIAYMSSPKMLNAEDGYGPTKPSGTGPFIFKEWAPNSFFKAVKNPRYWRKGLPYLDSIEFRPITNENSRYASLQSGSIDIMHTDVASLIKEMSTNPDISFVTDQGKVIGEPDMGFILINTTDTKMPLGNIYARQALAWATDTSAYLSVIGDNINPYTNSPFVEGTPYYKPDVPYPKYNLSKAIAAVENFKRSTGLAELSFVLGTTPSPSNNQTAQMLQNQWQKAGINVTIDNSIEQNTLIDNALLGNYDAYIWRQFAAVHPDLNYIFWYNDGLNFSRNNDPLIDSALDDARSNPNLEVQAKDYQTVSERFAIDLPYIWLSRDVWAIAAGSGVNNYNNPTTPTGAKAFPMISGIIWPTEIWINK